MISFLCKWNVEEKMLELEFEDKNHQVEKRRGHSRNRKNIYAGMLVGNRSILLLILCVNERQKAK